MLCPLCKTTSRGIQCLRCYKDYTADVRAGRIPPPLTADNYEYGTWEKIQLIKRQGIASNWTDEKITQAVREFAESEAECLANIQRRRAEEHERQKKMREELARRKFDF